MPGTKNKYTDLNNLLFEQLERLSDCETAEELKNEIGRSKAITEVAGKIIDNGALVLEAEKLKMEYRTDGDMTPSFAGLLEG